MKFIARSSNIEEVESGQNKRAVIMTALFSYVTFNKKKLTVVLLDKLSSNFQFLKGSMRTSTSQNTNTN